MPAEAPVSKPVQRQLEPLDLPMVPFVLIGMAGWLIAGLILFFMRHSLDAQGRGIWLHICYAGFLVALPGLALMLVHDRNRRIRRRKS